MDNLFDRIIAIVFGSEGGYSDDPRDPGNWTSGKCGEGELRGTKYGISAAAYPTLDISGLTLADAAEKLQIDYWDRIGGEDLKTMPALALLVFDAAVNNGPERAARWLQEVVAIDQDGIIGPETLNRLHGAWHAPVGPVMVCAAYMTLRLRFMAALPLWHINAGWARRLCLLPYQAMTLGFTYDGTPLA